MKQKKKKWNNQKQCIEEQLMSIACYLVENLKYLLNQKAVLLFKRKLY